jgi:hypothetical protein
MFVNCLTHIESFLSISDLLPRPCDLVLFKITFPSSAHSNRDKGPPQRPLVPELELDQHVDVDQHFVLAKVWCP